MTQLPLKTIRGMLKEKHEYKISGEGVIFIRDFLSDLINEVVDTSIIQLEQQNTLRYNYNLPQLKTISLQHLTTAIGKSYKLSHLCNIYGMPGHILNRDTGLSEAEQEAIYNEHPEIC